MQIGHTTSGGKALRMRIMVLLIGTLALLMALQGLINPQLTANAATAPTLGTATNFTVLAASTVTNTGPSVINGGSLGVSPGSAVTGFPPGLVQPPGTIQAGNAVALQAQNDVTTAYNNLTGQPCTSDLTGQDLGGMILTSGVYCFPNTSAQLTGALTLDAAGDPNAVFIFKIGSTLTTASASSVLGTAKLNPCNVFWQVGSSATLGTGTSFAGNILALASITLNTNANISGRALARTGAVTLDTNNISTLACPHSLPHATAPATATATANPTATPISRTFPPAPVTTAAPVENATPITVTPTPDSNGTPTPPAGTPPRPTPTPNPGRPPLPNTGPNNQPVETFPETGFSLSGTLLSFWHTNGGLSIFGFPIDSERETNQQIFQWFERNRLELHPENTAPYNILLGRLGAEILAKKGIDWTTLPKVSAAPEGCLYFSQTGHSLCGEFLPYWQSQGLKFEGSGSNTFAESLALFGLPLSEPRLETNSSGDTVMTQWFERARFEYHPDNPSQFRVLLGRLGAELKVYSLSEQ